MWRQVQFNFGVLLYITFFASAHASERQAQEDILRLPGDAKKIEINRIDGINDLINKNNLSKAKVLVQQQLRKYPDDSDYLILLSRIQKTEGKVSEAIMTLQKARSIAKKYEDIYIIEAGLLKEQGAEISCRQLEQLASDYEKYTPKRQADMFEALALGETRGINQLEIGAGYDKLSNNRGVWRSASISNRYVACSGNSLRAGYQKVSRYERDDAEVSVGAELNMKDIWLDIEYRESDDPDILAQNTLSGLLGFKTGLSADVFLLGSRKKFNGIETNSAGLGVDYYISNYQIMVIGEETNYLLNGVSLDSSNVQRIYLGYYFDRKTYIRFGYISGKELDNDGSENPPYGKVKTVLFNTFIPITTQAGILVEAKKHYQNGYFEQNGIRLALRYTY